MSAASRGRPAELADGVAKIVATVHSAMTPITSQPVTGWAYPPGADEQDRRVREGRDAENRDPPARTDPRFPSPAARTFHRIGHEPQ
ncbi:hypothetical protein GCM10018952_22400 [Streptosporangium vulgare]